jgi:solute carrier family 66, member 2
MNLTTNLAHCSYWQFLVCLFVVLAALELLIAPFDSIYPAYSALTGYIGLSVEATLPLPQLYANAQSKSCKGFRFSVLASWIVGDSMKMFWFFTATTEIPLAFKLCGVFQAICDALIGVQYFVYGNQKPPVKSPQEWELASKSSSSDGWQSPVRRAPVADKGYY